MFTQIKTLLTCLLISSVISSFTANAETKFGRGADMGKLTAISTVLSTPEDYLSKEITIKGKVMSVCQNKGCWMKLASDAKQQALRIKVKDGAMIFPLHVKNKTAFATGTLTAKQLTKQQTITHLQHMADESDEDFDAESITQGIIIYQLVPIGVTIKE